MKKKPKKEPKKKGKPTKKRQLKADIAVLAEMLALLVPEHTNGLDAKQKLIDIRDRWGMQL